MSGRLHAVIFDIDGTLLDSNGVDAELYIAAVEKVLGRVRIRSHWSEYEHVTDSGILAEMLLDNGIRGDGQVIAAVKSTFIGNLRRHLDKYGPFSDQGFILKILLILSKRTQQKRDKPLQVHPFQFGAEDET